MNPRFLLVIACLCLTVSAFAVSSNDAVNYIVNGNHFLYEGENYTPPNVPISHGEADYWVIPITAGNDVVTYFPVDTKLGALPASNSDNREIFTVADNLRELQLAKASITPNSGTDWIFTQKYQTIFSEMSLQISDETFQLNTVETALKKSGIAADLGQMKTQLKSMVTMASSISEKVAAASQAENDFTTIPSAESFAAMDGAFEGVFDSIESLNTSFMAYNSARNRLKQQISLADIEAQEKSQLSSILEIPISLQSLGNYNINSGLLEEKLGSAFKGTGLRMDSLLDEYGKRVLKNSVYNTIYAENEKIKKDTPFISLSEARSNILSPANRAQWLDQARANQLEQDYSRALKYYGEKNFGQANKYALAAIEDAISVYRKGRKPDVQPPPISQEFLFQAAAVLLVLLVLLYAFNNRAKLKGAIAKEAEEVNPYE